MRATIARRGRMAELEISDDWTPTGKNLNALPEPLRRYIHDLQKGHGFDRTHAGKLQATAGKLRFAARMRTARSTTADEVGTTAAIKI